jgi:NAD(P)-dependent dehydrogenase (short-subunit alcohol dehydrogenase family)
MGDDLTAGGLRTYKNSVCIITGAASGIGKEMTLELGKRGAKAIVLMDMQDTLAEKVAAMLREMGVESTVHMVDVRDFKSVQQIINKTMTIYGRLDYMINNAGILVIGPIEKIGLENFNYTFDVNVLGVHHGVQAAYPIMKNQRFGHIVNVSSLLGLIPGGQWAVAYGASKHAVVGLSTNLRIEAAKYGVRVSCFCPGTIDTPIHTGGEYGKNLTGVPSKTWAAQVAKMKAMDAKACAAIALDKIANNEALFVVPFKPMLVSRLFYRLSPSIWLQNKVHKIDWRRNLSKGIVSEQEQDKVKEQ